MRIALLSICLLLSYAVSAQEFVRHTIHFDSDQSEISSEEKLEATTFIQTLSGYNECYLSIIGHTDQDGDLDYNMDLSEARATNVQDYIASIGSPDWEVNVDYQGEEALISHSDDEDTKWQNRRVELIAEVYQYGSLEELFPQISSFPTQAKQQHTIDISQTSNVTLEKGTEVTIPQDAFEYLDGSPVLDTEVMMVFKEAYDYSDMITHGLFTQTDSEMIETGGMIYIAASADGKELKLKADKSIEVKMAAQIEKDDMQLFLPADGSSGSEWVATDQDVEVEKTQKKVFLKLDMTPITDYEVELERVAKPTFTPMPRLPRLRREPMPPSKRMYTKAEYEKVYAKYEVSHSEYQEEAKSYPDRLSAWKDEARARINTIRSYRSQLRKIQVGYKLKGQIARVARLQDSISNDMLIKEFSDYYRQRSAEMYTPLSDVKKAAFQNQMHNVNEIIGINIAEKAKVQLQDYFPELAALISGMIKSVFTRKVELGLVSDEQMVRYVLSSSSLGWINCDRFRDFEEDALTDVAITGVADYGTNLMIFHNIKSMFAPRGKITSGTRTYSRIPKGEEVTIISIHFKDKKPYLATRDLTIGDIESIPLDYKPSSARRINRLITKLERT
jgi:hypothetical protein